MRLVNLDKFPLLPNKLEGHLTEYERGYLDAQSNLNALPNVDAEPVRHGRWGDAALLKSNFMFRNGLHATQRQCTSCHRYSAQLYDYPMVVPEVYQYRFCPHCGAKMDEVSE